MAQSPRNSPDTVHLSPMRGASGNNRQLSPSSISADAVSRTDSGSSSQTLAPPVTPEVSRGSPLPPSTPIHDMSITNLPRRDALLPPSTPSSPLPPPVSRHSTDPGSSDRPKKSLPTHRRISPQPGQVPYPDVRPNPSPAISASASHPELKDREPAYNESSQTPMPSGSSDLPHSTEILKRIPFNTMVEPRRCTHHDGSVYFYYPYLQTVTRLDYDLPKRQALVRIRDNLLTAIGDSHGPDIFRRRWELHLDILEQTKPSPLFVLLDNERCFSYPNNGEVVPQETSKTRFWLHLESFPMHDPKYSSKWGTDFINALCFGSNERILEHKETTFPFTDEQSKRLIEVFNDLMRICAESVKYGGHANQLAVSSLIWHVARTMIVIQETRDRYKWGTPEARMYRDVAIDRPTPLVGFVDFVLLFCSFGTHRMYRTRLQKTVVQGVVYLPDFRDLVKSFLAEWSDSNLLATVFVSANVAFLAVPNISDLQRTASLASSVFAMTSILTGVHHVWQHRGKVDVGLIAAESYLGKQNHQLRDLTIRGCFLSLPISTLLWSVISFALAIAAYSMEETVLLGKLFIGCILGVLGVLGLLTIHFFWGIWKRPRTEEIGQEEEEEESAGWGGIQLLKGIMERVSKRFK